MPDMSGLSLQQQVPPPPEKKKSGFSKYKGTIIQSAAGGVGFGAGAAIGNDLVNAIF
jgi:LAS seventeen-binding protein 1/2